MGGISRYLDRHERANDRATFTARLSINPEYIFRQVVRVSLETVKIVVRLPGEFELGAGEARGSVRPPGEKGSLGALLPGT